ncbi:MAG TPA: hypothetical protein VN213_06520 [Solirubrobacteraceae bacterium]|nr:hypothetical protein [Solirubrobacteraceae bacterium]
MRRRPTLLLVALAAAGVAAFGAGAASGGAAQNPNLPQGAEPVRLDPADFTATIDNPYLPLAVGARWSYREGPTRGTITVLADTKTIEGAEARVVHDVARERGRVVEDTFDWYAQDRQGNVWYLGEDTTAFDPGRPPSKEGSWQHGVDGAYAGVVMPARPAPGLRYRQEYYEGHAEDEARVVARGEYATVPAGFYRDLVMTRDTTPLEPRVLEYKFYARGVGMVLALTTSGGDREELVSYRRGG